MDKTWWLLSLSFVTSLVNSLSSFNGISYAQHWEELLTTEYTESTAALREQRRLWSDRRLQATGITLLDASAEPDSDLLGDKIVRIHKKLGDGDRLMDKFARGDMLLLTTTQTGEWMTTRTPVPRECCIVDIGSDWMTVGVGPSWPSGLWESRRLPGSYRVRLDRTVCKTPLQAQRKAIERIRKGEGGPVAEYLTRTFVGDEEGAKSFAANRPGRLQNVDNLEEKVDEAILTAAKGNALSNFNPNESQYEAISWALRRRVALVRGPPGTGKTRLASLLIGAALEINVSDDENLQPTTSPKILAVAHSNGAADVLLEALLQTGVPAIRLGRPANVQPSVRHRTVAALSDRHPEVVRLRETARNVTLEAHERSMAQFEISHTKQRVESFITESAPVVVASCIGAHQLLLQNISFSTVVLDEAAQTTEPALLCALAASTNSVDQLVMVGDTRQLPPTISLNSQLLRETLAVSPMARLESLGVDQKTLTLQYRMPPSLLEFASERFYRGMVQCASSVSHDILPPCGFDWPNPTIPLAFLAVEEYEVAHEFGGRSNPTEADKIADIVVQLTETSSTEEIAIISPYSKQVQLIRAELQERRIQGVKIGTVDSFQGQETDIVIFSAVRSNEMREMGFLRDPRRLCVATTRARKGLILLGNPGVLQTSRHWEALLSSCRRRGCFVEAIGSESSSLEDGTTKRGISTDDLAEALDGSSNLLGLF